MNRLIAYQSQHRIKYTKFPKKIWQTWKVDPLDFDERDSSRARIWTSLNPGRRYEVLTDGIDLEYVESHFGPDGIIDRPDIIETYRSFNAIIIKADFLRYLIMFVEGGVYADIDVEALRPIDTWIPENFSESEVDFIISVEVDEPDFINHTILGPKSQSFCQWTFVCKPRLPVVMRLIDHVLYWLYEVSQRQNVPISDIQLVFDEAITGTGPSAFTAAILAEMSAQMHRHAFAARQGHSNSGSYDSDLALIKHHYHASLWPSRHPRYSHLAYGMVEECNWKPDCVAEWTENTNKFDFLPEDQQQKLISEKEGVDKARFDQEEAEKEAAAAEEKAREDADFLKACATRYIERVNDEFGPKSGQSAGDAAAAAVEDEARKDAENGKKVSADKSSVQSEITQTD